MTDPREFFYRYLKAKGLKRTVQRDAILETFLEMERHLSPEELYQAVKRKHPHVGFSTVYRTLKILSQCNLAREMRSKDGQSVFEHKLDHPHHDHLVCNRCGKYIEFFNETIEQLQDRIAKEHNFTISGHRLEIFGICSECEDSS